MNWFVAVIKKYAEFSGRARRKEYWMFVLFYVLIAIGLSVVESLLGFAGILSGIFGLALLLPSIAVTIRRLHDTDRSGWWILIGFVPFVGFIVLLVFMCLVGSSGSNPYGSDPLQEAEPA
jgi:uncharacterized membrane protein YhaH (DUF805 family)